jgi:magnesium chelatase subunit D
MLTGGLDVETAMREGRRVYRPGLFARAHRGILYIDEVNLLDDHLVDMVLDVASSGVAIVEREGVSARHPARFILVGTMNPEEGSLRPHLLDRFGLCAGIGSDAGVENRVRILENRESYDGDPEAFRAAHAASESALASLIREARDSLHRVVFPRRLGSFASEMCLRNGVAGHRGDLVIRQASAALAAYEGRGEVTAADIERVASLALAHRRRDAAPTKPAHTDGPRADENAASFSHRGEEPEGGEGGPAERSERGEGDAKPGESPGNARHGEEMTETGESPGNAQQEEGRRDHPRDSAGPPPREEVFSVGDPFRVRRIEQSRDRMVRSGSGRRSRTRAMRRGRYVKSRIGADVRDIALDATLAAAAPHQVFRTAPPRLRMAIHDSDIRERVRERRVAAFILFIVDASGSMGALSRMIATKGAILSLLIDAYQKRDRVALVCFRRREASVTLQPTSSAELAARELRELPVGGRTPLSLGLREGFRVLKMHLIREPRSRPIAIILTDGKANVSLEAGALPHEEALRVAVKMSEERRVRYVVVDTETSGVASFGLAARLAAALGGEYARINDLRARDLLDMSAREAGAFG